MQCLARSTTSAGNAAKRTALARSASSAVSRPAIVPDDTASSVKATDPDKVRTFDQQARSCSPGGRVRHPFASKNAELIVAEVALHGRQSKFAEQNAGK